MSKLWLSSEPVNLSVSCIGGWRLHELVESKVSLCFPPVVYHCRHFHELQACLADRFCLVLSSTWRVPLQSRSHPLASNHLAEVGAVGNMAAAAESSGLTLGLYMSLIIAYLL
jgi:hypothetical protein